MEKLNVSAHTSYIGTTGISNHFRFFFREVSKHCNLKVRSFTIGKTWRGLDYTPHNNEPYINDIDKSILYRQTLFSNGKRVDYPIYTDYTGPFDANIVADIVDHYYFYDQYNGPKIGYTVWESSRYPLGFFNKLKEFDEVWAASVWQKQCMVEQGLPEQKVKVVPAGVEANIFYPYPIRRPKDVFTFVVVGRWTHRKSTLEIIQTFLRTFKKQEPVELVIAVDNGYPLDGMKSTEERLSKFNINDKRIKIVHETPRNDYIALIRGADAYLSCSRGEGWNLPLIEAMASGVPSIYSNCSAQLEFANGLGNPVNIVGMSPAETKEAGEYFEPDFDHLSVIMRDVYENSGKHVVRAVEESVEIRNKFDWSVVGQRGFETIKDFSERFNRRINVKKSRLKILFVAPHLSTGGMPQYLLKKIQMLNDSCDIHCIEYEQIATEFVVQRNAIASILGDRFYSLNGKPKEKLLEMIDTIKPDVVHFEEFPETFVDRDVATKIYRKDRNYLIFEGYHGIYFNANEKMFFPDKFSFVSEFQAEKYKHFGVPYIIAEYPIEVQEPNKELYRKELGFEDGYKHVINVGLFTRGKNQSELIEYARSMLDKKVKFHFIGNRAGNFEDYWGPLLKTLPSNCVLWGERGDVEKFYQAADLMVFTSRMETSPLVIREAIGWKLPTFIHNLPAYKNMYAKYGVMDLHPTNLDQNVQLIKKQLHL